MSTYKLNTIGNSSELYFHSCTEVLTASRSYTEIFFFNSPHVAQSCNRSQCNHCMSTTRRALLHSTHIYIVSPNSRVLLYKILLYLCVYTVIMFYTVYVRIYIYNTVALIKNTKKTTSRKLCCKEDKPAGCVRNETAC